MSSLVNRLILLESGMKVLGAFGYSERSIEY
jgi:hypothetical protein